MRKLRDILVHILPVLILLNVCMAVEAGIQDNSGEESITLSGIYPGFEGDQLRIIYWDSLPFSNSLYNLYEVDTIILDERGTFSFQTQKEHPVHFSVQHIKKGDNRMKEVLDQYVAEPGDNIQMIATNDKSTLKNSGSLFFDFSQTISFSGEGLEKYQLRYQLMEAWQNAAVEHFQKPFQPQKLEADKQSDDPLVSKMEGHWDFFLVWKKIADDILDKYREDVNRKTFDIIKADVYGEMMFYRLLRPLHIFCTLEQKKNGLYPASAGLIEWYRDHIMTNMPETPDEALIASSWYPNLLIYKAIIEADLLTAGDSITPFEILNKYPPLPRDRLITEYLTVFDNTFRNKKEWSERVNQSLGFIETEKYRNLLTDTLLNKDVGVIVYDFELPDKDGNFVKLSDFKGKIVVLDFWFTECSGCMQFFQNHLSKAEKHFADNDKIVFITVSIDADKEKWLKSLYSGKYTSLDVVNLYTAGKGATHPVVNKLGIRSYPTPFIIDSEGKMYHNELSSLTRAVDNKLIETLERALAENKF